MDELLVSSWSLHSSHIYPISSLSKSHSLPYLSPLRMGTDTLSLSIVCLLLCYRLQWQCSCKPGFTFGLFIKTPWILLNPFSGLVLKYYWHWQQFMMGVGGCTWHEHMFPCFIVGSVKLVKRGVKILHITFRNCYLLKRKLYFLDF